ncbi:MAG: peptide chain release factor N(5)-glutamine methyltransferase [Desulfovermiculus sp.]|nr:peptide chain release factor N(5)-glutamine methyltransferase [Desulfovermiculus sp.]
MSAAQPSLLDSLHLAEKRLRRSGVDSPRLSAELLMARTLGVDRLWVLTHLDTRFAPQQALAYEASVGQRATGRPIAYLTGKREFYGRDFQVSSDVLIPRPETEVLLEWAQSLWSSGAELTFADAGTGCGAIGVCFASLFPKSRGVLTDRSISALRMAMKNVTVHKLDPRLFCICADLVSTFRRESLDAVLSNPPYISSADYWQLSPEIRHFEPGLALWGGMHGIEAPLRLIQQAYEVLRPGGWLVMEIGHDQFSLLLDWMQTRFGRDWSEVGVVQDWAGRDRVLRAKKV